MRSFHVVTAVPGSQVVSGAVASQVAVAVWEPETLSVGRQSPYVDALARGWWKAFERARSALRAAGPYLSGDELGERSRRLAEERSDVARLLESLARDLQADSRFVRWPAAATTRVKVAYAANPAVSPARRTASHEHDWLHGRQR